MLSNLERYRLKTRDTDPPKIRAMNDMRVKKKLRAWLDDGFDALEIFQSLPSDRLKEEFSDDDVNLLFKLSEKLMNILGFWGIKGSITNRASWRVTPRRYDEFGIPTPISDPQPATPSDIKQSWIVEEHRRALAKHRTRDKLILMDLSLPNRHRILKKYEVAFQHYDPALTMATYVNLREMGVNFENWNDSNFYALLDEITEIIRPTGEPKKEDVPEDYEPPGA